MSIARGVREEANPCSVAKTRIPGEILSILEFTMMWNPDPLSSSVSQVVQLLLNFNYLEKLHRKRIQT